MRSLKLGRNGQETRYYYSFKCLSIASPNIVQTQGFTTPADGGTGSGRNGAGSVVFLDRHAVKCDSNKVLTQVQLKTQGTQGQSGYKIQYGFS